MIRVLNIINWGLGMGGAETTIMNYYRNLDCTVVQYDFLTPKRREGMHYEAEAVELGARFFRYPIGKIFGSKKLKRAIWLFRFMRGHKEYNIVHIHHDEPKEVIVEILLLTLCRVRCRNVCCHNALPGHSKPRKDAVKKLLLRLFATHMLACSTEAGISMFGSKAVRNKKFGLLFNARETEPFKFNPIMRENTRRALNIHSKFVLINIGRLSPQKNQVFLLKAFSIAYKRNTNILLLIAGKGELHEEIESEIIALGLEDSVQLLGLRNDVPELLQAADVFVLPSLYEGLPGVAIEAQASGLPCLVSDAVTRECKVTDNVEFLPIDKGPEIWAERMLAYNGFERRDTVDDVRRAGYDIREAAKWLEEFYLSVG